MTRQDGTPKPPLMLITGCLAILLVTAVQVWRSATNYPVPQPYAGAELDFHPPQPQYSASIRAEVVLDQPQVVSVPAIIVEPKPPVAANAAEVSNPSSVELPLEIDSPPQHVMNPKPAIEEPQELEDWTFPDFRELVPGGIVPPPGPDYIATESVTRPAKLVNPRSVIRINPQLMPATAPAEPEPEPIPKVVQADPIEPDVDSLAQSESNTGASEDAIASEQATASENAIAASQPTAAPPEIALPEVASSTVESELPPSAPLPQDSVEPVMAESVPTQPDVSLDEDLLVDAEPVTDLATPAPFAATDLLPEPMTPPTSEVPSTPVAQTAPVVEAPSVPIPDDGQPAPVVSMTPASEPTLPRSKQLAPIAAPADIPGLEDTPLPPSLADQTPEDTDKDDVEPITEPAPRRKKAGVLRRVRRTKPTKPAVLPTAWPAPRALLRTFQSFKDPYAAAWAKQVSEELARLQRSKSLNALDATVAIERLAELSTTPKQIARNIPDRKQQSLFLSAGYDLQRRVTVWSAVTHAIQPTAKQKVSRILTNRDASRMNRVLGELAEALGSGPTARQWVGFLEMNELARLNIKPLEESVGDSRNVAIRVLDRLASDNLTDAQATIVNSKYVRSLTDELRTWSTVPIDYKSLLQDIEKYEFQSNSATGNSLAAAISQMLWSRSEEQNRIGSILDTHYRNANLRLAMTQKFMQRMLPVMQDVRAPIRDQILGARVFGNSASWTRIGVGLVPDPNRIHLQLQARGHVATNTRSFKGPVVVYNRNRAEFFLRKPLIFSNEGVYIGRSDTVANGTMKTLGLRTQYDNYPLIGSIVRRAANRELFEQRHLARRIFDRRVASNAQRQVDNQLSKQMAQTQEHLRVKLIEPLERLGLQPANMTMQTTGERIIYRGRLAGDHQLASHMARPQALANNLVSLQFHESMVNNMLQQIKLNGVEGDLQELLSRMATRMKSFEMKVPDEIPDNVHIKMAPRDAVAVRFVDDMMRVTLRISELRTSRRSWNNFAVTASYVPTGSGFQVEVNRTGVVELTGKRLKMRDQVALRGIFTKVFSKNRTSKLLHPNLANDERLSDLNVNQIVMRNGWLGLSVGTDGSVSYANRPEQNVRR